MKFCNEKSCNLVAIRDSLYCGMHQSCGVTVNVDKFSLVTEFDKLVTRMRETLVNKNADYSRGDDPFKNFRRHGEYGIVVRMDDKISRLDSLCRPGSDGIAKVSNESIEDTALDLANYALLLVMLRRSNVKQT